MRHRHLAMMLSKYGRHRHMASKTDIGLYYSLCGRLMDDRRTNRVLTRDMKLVFTDCVACSKLL